MILNRIVLGAATACAALVGLTATAANAHGWGQGIDSGGGRWGYEGRGYGDDYGYPASRLFQREDRLGGWIRRMSYEGRMDGGEAGRAWRMLSDARRQTVRETREHGGLLPAHDYQDISERLNALERYLRHEASEDDDD